MHSILKTMFPYSFSLAKQDSEADFSPNRTQHRILNFEEMFKNVFWKRLFQLYFTALCYIGFFLVYFRCNALQRIHKCDIHKPRHSKSLRNF